MYSYYIYFKGSYATGFTILADGEAQAKEKFKNLMSANVDSECLECEQLT